jgi:hypothetical protein
MLIPVFGGTRRQSEGLSGMKCNRAASVNARLHAKAANRWRSTGEAAAVANAASTNGIKAAPGYT